MSEKKVYRAIGLMSGTSLDGIDCALIETDGDAYVKPLKFITRPYEEGLRTRLRACFGKKEGWDKDAEREMTLAHAEIIKELGEQADIIGFHGQTIYHAPHDGITVHIGDGALLAQETGINVVADMRSADVAAGGEGAPLAPLYHKARLSSGNAEFPAVILNIGGVGNVTYVDEGTILAFDTGPGNALMDDWAQKHTGARFDKDGALAAKGKPQEAYLKQWLAHPYFNRTPPKALDRDEWDIAALGSLSQGMGHISPEDGAATLLRFTAKTIIQSMKFMPGEPNAWYVCGGGRHNKALMDYLSERLPIATVEDLGWNGDATEAECFAYLAVRSLLGEPLSLPTTTGVKSPQTGGVLHHSSKTGSIAV